MTPEIDYINSTALPSPNGFTHVTVGASARLVFVSGQVAYGEDGAVVGPGDLAAQTHQVFVNLSRALESAGSDFEHVLKLTFFVKNISEEAVATIRQVRKTFLVSSRLPASTMVGVAGLAKEALLLEVEAYAMQRSRA